MTRLERLALFAIAFVATSFVGGGVPVLRHDWPPVETNVFSALDSVAGWNPIGLGLAVSYPSSFLIVPARALMAAVTGAYAAHIIYFTGANLLIAFGAARLGRGPLTRVSFASFALFNPWMYTQVVAGHLFMILSYGATLWLAAEVKRGIPNPRTLCLLALAIAPQIQFLAVDSLAYVYLAARFKIFRPAVVMLCMWLPVLVGIAANRGSLVTTPFTLQWEFSQSIPIAQASVLSGYFTHYDRSIEPISTYASIGIAGVALLGAIAAVIRRGFGSASYAILLSVVPLIFASGVQGPLAPVFSWMVQHIVGIALFRELYDLLAFVVIGYLVACALALDAFRPIAVVVCIVGLALPIAWLLGPPARYFVFDESLPKLSVLANPSGRVVLLPALYPVSADTRGSGIDPDLRPRIGNATVLNEYAATYPFSSALGQYLSDGSTSGFARLGAGRIYSRPWLSTSMVVGAQLALPLPHWLPRLAPDTTSSPVMPMLGISALPEIGTVDQQFGSGNVLFSDARVVRGPDTPPSWARYPPILPIRADNTYAVARLGWVDARLAFVERPSIATPYGGAYTVSSRNLLPVIGGMDALIWVRGRLVDETSKKLSSTTNGFRWLRLGRNTDAVRCFGECIVAVQGNVPAGLPLNPSPHPVDALSFDAITPWLISCTIPSVPATKLLRLDVAYDPLWLAWTGNMFLAHVRIDGVTNAWILPTLARPRHAIIMEFGAFLVALSESVAAIVTLVVLSTFLPYSSKLMSPSLARTTRRA